MPITPDPFQHLDPNRSLAEQWTVERVNQLLDRCRSNELMPGINAFVSRVGGGVALNPKRQRGGSLHPLTVVDASTNSVAGVTVTPGVFARLVPTINGNPINVQIGSPLAYPVLTCSSGDEIIYFSITYNSSNIVTAVAILSGTMDAFSALQESVNIAPGVAGTDYYGLSSINAILTPSPSTSPLNDYVSGPQGYLQCGNTSQCWLT